MTATITEPSTGGEPDEPGGDLAGPREGERDEQPWRPGGNPDDNRLLAGAALGSLAFTWLCFERLLPFSGTFGFAICWYAVFLAMYTLVLFLDNDHRQVTDRLAKIAVQSAGVVVLGALVTVVVFTVYRGAHAIRWNFLTQTMAFTPPSAPLNQGGALAAIVGTLEQVALATLFTVPLGVGTAIFLNEVRGPLARPVRTVIDAMSALPSIVAGLFVFVVFVRLLGLGRCGLAASIAVSMEMLPIITRASEVVLRIVPGGLREASLALGASQWRTVWSVVLPTARAGLLTAVILGVARGIGETAPVLLTSGYTAELVTSPVGRQQVSLPLFVFTFVHNTPFPEVIARAYGAALVLLVLVLALFVLARLIARQSSRGARGGRSRPAPGDPLSPDPDETDESEPAETRPRLVPGAVILEGMP